jgi:hypothetical protein
MLQGLLQYEYKILTSLKLYIATVAAFFEAFGFSVYTIKSVSLFFSCLLLGVVYLFLKYQKTSINTIIVVFTILISGFHFQFYAFVFWVSCYATFPPQA